MSIHCQDRIEDIFKNGKVSDNDGKMYPLRSNIDRNEGEFLYKIIREHQCRKTLEVGCAMGISSLFICSALERLEGASHTIVDPNQTTYWNSLGITQLDRAEVNYYRLVEEPSEYALPRWAKQGEKYDFCFIDGWHTFDHTLLDFFYVDRLLDVGGIVAIDDVGWPSIKKVIRYVSNYPNYKLIGCVPRTIQRGMVSYLYKGLTLAFRPIAKVFQTPRLYSIFSNKLIVPDAKLGLDSSMLAFQKTGQDSRSWDWYVDF